MIIRQRTRHDCAICTIAMATAKSYEAVIAEGLRSGVFDADKGCHGEYRILELLGFEQMKDFRVLSNGILLPEYFRNLSWRRRAIMSVPSLNTPGGWHSVYFDGTDVLDPCDLKTYSTWNELRPTEMILFAT